MAITIGSIHVPGTMTPEQPLDYPFYLAGENGTSLYDPEWEDPMALHEAAGMLSAETGRDVLAFYCFDEDAMGLTLLRAGESIAECAVSAYEELMQEPRNMEAIVEAFGIADPGGTKLLSILQPDMPVDACITELETYLGLQLLPNAKLFEEMYG